MIKVTTLKQAQDLPEVLSSMFEYVYEVDARGDTTCTPVVRPFVAQPTEGDQILFFTDIDGRSMTITYTEDGPAKTTIL